MRAVGLAVALLLFAVEAFAQAQFRNAGATLIAEQVVNKVIQPTERVTVSLALKNVGSETASNLVATIQSGNGVSNPDPGSRSYGTIPPWAPSVAQEFTFTCNAPSNALLNVYLDLEASGSSLGTVSFRFRVGPGTLSVTNGDSIVINDLARAAPYPSVLSVSNVPGTIINISITLSNLSHLVPDDIDMLLVSPAGDTVMIMSDTCGNVHLNNITLTLSDFAPTPLPDVGAALSAVHRPANYGVSDPLPSPAPLGPYASVLSAFNGKEANGDWKLFVFDDAGGETGSIGDGWALHITTLQPMAMPPGLTLLGRTSNNMIRFSVSGRPGYTYAIEDSPDPVQSFPVESFVMPPSGVRVFQYPLGSENRFYRAVWEP